MPAALTRGSMATPAAPSTTVSAAPSESISDIDATTDAKWAELAASESVPAESPAESPTPAEAKPESPKPEVVSNTPEAEAPAITPQDKSARENLLAKFNGDEEAAAKWAWENNNRAAEMARKVKELEDKLSAGSNSAPNEAQVQPPAETPAPVAAPAAQEIDQYVDALAKQDPQVLQWNAEFTNNDAEIKRLAGVLPTYQAEIRKREAWLELDQVKADEFETARIKRELLDYRAEYSAARYDHSSLTLQNKNLLSEFGQWQNRTREELAGRVQEQFQAQQVQVEYTQKVERHAKDLAEAWTPALQATVTKYQIPESEAEDFAADVRRAALAQLESGFRVEDVSKLMEQEAKRLMDRLDRHHRLRSGEYARAAKERAAQPAPTPSASAQIQASNDSDPLEAVYARAELGWKNAAGI